MSVYSIKAVASVTGLTPETIRVWERRYGVVSPERDGEGRRLYSHADVRRLQLLARATRIGHRIGRLVQFSDTELEHLLAEGEALGPGGGVAGVVRQIVEAAAVYDIRRCEALLAHALLGSTGLGMVEEVLAPLMREVGERWHSQSFSVAQEHLISAMVERQVMALLHLLEGGAVGPQLVVGTLSGERHGFGALLATLVAAYRGARCDYLGTDLPAAELAEAARRRGADVVAVSVIAPPRWTDAARHVAALRAALPRRIELWLGGQGARELAASGALPPAVPVLPMPEFADRLGLGDPARRG
ncbi:MAG TPA: MerR family transcriptional regulator [Alphaproteobacteria bacterium]|nr:MerR family transcriptional regulator [Alphaproteobacteria bacterium]